MSLLLPLDHSLTRQGQYSTAVCFKGPANCRVTVKKVYSINTDFYFSLLTWQMNSLHAYIGIASTRWFLSVCTYIDILIFFFKYCSVTLLTYPTYWQVGASIIVVIKLHRNIKTSETQAVGNKNGSNTKSVTHLSLKTQGFCTVSSEHIMSIRNVHTLKP